MEDMYKDVKSTSCIVATVYIYQRRRYNYVCTNIHICNKT